MSQDINIAKEVADLLKVYDCVIIPQFGGFVGNYEPAKISESGQKVLPPSKTVFYNKSLVKNDGLLANEIARKNNIDYNSAVTYIDGFVTKLNTVLQQGKSVNFYPIGQLSYDNSINSVVCKINKEYNFLGDSFGFSDLMLPVVENDIRKDLKKKYKETFNTNKSKRTFLKRYWPIAAAIPFAAFLMIYPFKSNIEHQALGFFSNSEQKGIFEPRNQWSDLTEIYKWSDDLNKEDNVESKTEVINTKKSKGITEVKEKIKKNNIITSTLENQEKKFYIVAGSFGVEDNAYKFAKSLKEKGFEASVFDNTGNLYRVSYFETNTREEALAKLIEINKNPKASAWIMEK